jgi:MYXO-CTERM domain-containing protein
LQLGFARDQIHGRSERTIRAVVGDLRREVNRHTKGHAQDIQKPKERVPPEITQNVPPKDAKILVDHAASLQPIFGGGEIFILRAGRLCSIEHERHAPAHHATCVFPTGEIYPLRAVIRCMVRPPLSLRRPPFGRNTAILAVGLALALVLSPQDAAGAQSPLHVTNTGTILQAERASSNAIAPVTLSSANEWSASSPDILATASKISNLPASVISNYEPVASIQSLLALESGNFTAPFVAWPDETTPFQEVTAAPEPSTWVAALFTLALLAWTRRRRLLSRAIS